jgi:hypothetical protein
MGTRMEIRRLKLVEINVKDMSPQLKEITRKETVKVKKFESMLIERHKEDF